MPKEKVWSVFTLLTGAFCLLGPYVVFYFCALPVIAVVDSCQQAHQEYPLFLEGVIDWYLNGIFWGPFLAGILGAAAGVFHLIKEKACRFLKLLGILLNIAGMLQLCYFIR